MGAWNYGVFDDDTAYDALDNLKVSQEIITDMKKYFDAVIGEEFVDYDKEHSYTVLPGIGGGSGGTERRYPRYAVDSCPVMVAKRSYSTGAKVGARFCNKCYNAARQERYYGVKLHIFAMLRPGRLPLLRAAQLSLASCPEW